MAKRTVKTADAALASTRKPVRLSTYDGLENVVAGLGTDRDKRSYSAYAQPRVLTRVELENMYRGSWLAKKIVNTVADDMTREGWHVMFDEDKEGDSQFAVEECEKRHAVRAKVNAAIKWARLYGGSLIILGTNDTKDLSKPLNVERLGKDSLRYMHVVDRWRVSPNGRLCTDLESPNFGLPEAYLLAESAVQVHHTRVLRFNGQKLPYFPWLQNAMWDDSELQHVYESLLNCDTTTAAVATMLFESNVDVIKAKDLSELLSTKDGEAKVTKRFQLASLMKSFNRTLLLDADEDYEKKSNTFSGLDKVMQQFMVDVSGAADIPMTRLFGQSAGGLNATGDNDVRNYYDMVSSKQEAEVRPQLDYLYQVLVRSELGSMPDDFRFDFNPLWQVSATEQATIDKTNADRDKVYLDAGVVTEGLVAAELKERGTYRNMTDDDVQLAEELAKEMQEAQVEGAKNGATAGNGEPPEGQDPDQAKGGAEKTPQGTPAKAEGAE